MDNSGDLSTSSGSENSTSGRGDVNATATDYWYSHYESFTISSSSTNEISTAGQLAYLAYMVNSGNSYSGYVFQLTTDLDMSAYYWVPIGGHEYDCSTTNTSYYFSGEFDGNSHTISGLDASYATSSSTYNYMGLFGYAYGTSSSKYCLIHEIGIVNSSISGYNYVGSILGKSYYYIRIYDCYNSSSVNGTGSYIGGLVGSTCNTYSSSAGYYTYLYRCYNIGIVTGGTYVGGLVGYTYSRRYSSSYSTTFNMYNCFNNGEVSGATVGGLIGYCYNYSSSYLYNYIYKCYYDSSYSDIGTGSYYSSSTSIASSTLSEDAKMESWYTTTSNWYSGYYWDFEFMWNIDETQNDGYPVFNQNGPDYYWISDASYYSTSWSGSGTSSDPYLIQCAADLALLAYNVYSSSSVHYSEVYFKQTCNIDLSAHYWMPIGGHYAEGTSISYYFSGNYDGGGYTISGLKTCYFIASSRYSYMGLFGCTYGTSSSQCNINDVVISSDSTIDGYQYVGGVVGYAYYYTNVYNCSNSGTVTGSSYYVGGIVGYVYGYSSSYLNQIYSCENAGEIIGLSYYVGGISGCANKFANIYDCDNIGGVTGSSSCVGGVVGYAPGGYIYLSSCSNTGSVVGLSKVGGIVGQIGTSDYNYLRLYNCYNSGFISGTSSVGGIAGYICANDPSVVSSVVSSSGIKVYNCYNTGNVLGTSNAVGGIVGVIGRQGVIYACYNIGNVTGLYNVGGIAGETGTSGYYIINCFNIGDVTSNSTDSSYLLNVAGVLGCVYSSYGYIYNSYYGSCSITGKDTAGNDILYQKGIGWNDTTSEEGADEETVTEFLDNLQSLAKMETWFTNSDNWYSSYSWNFSGDWVIYKIYNEGYPVLIVNLPDSDYVYDQSNDYWYFEDGYMPQGYYGDSAPSGGGECSSYYTLNITDSTWAKVSIYDVDEDSYAYVVLYSESDGEIASGWFKVEPIVWIVGYGSDVPTDFSTAVTAKIVTCGQMTSSAGATWSARRGMVVQSVQFFEFSTTFENAVETSWMYDSFSGSTSQIAVTDDAVAMSSLLTIASVEEIDALGGTYASTCTDFVAFLLSGGSSTDGDSYSADYWTRDLAASLDSESTYGEYTSVVQLNNGVYVTKDGTLSNAKLKTLMGARLTMSIG